MAVISIDAHSTCRSREVTITSFSFFLCLQTEQSLLDQDRLPETPEDFDRLVVSSPNNSVVWLQYMAYHLHTANIEKAKEVAERALKTISFRSVNFWLHLFGSK